MKLKKLLLGSMVSISALTGAGASNIPMTINVTPDFGYIQSTGLIQNLDIVHSGTNCKYSVAFKVYSNLNQRWGIKISAPALVSADGKQSIEPALVNYKIYGGAALATPGQDTNVWLPLPINPTLIYQCGDSEFIATEIDFIITVFVTPRILQMQKVFKSRVTIALVPL